MVTAKSIRASFQKLYEKLKSAKEVSEEDLRVAFVRSGILEALGYEGEPKDLRFEQRVRGKRSDLIAFDDYRNVVFVVEFKRPNEIEVEHDFAQLWDRYVKPLRAKYGLLTDGLELLIYERINSNWERKLHVSLSEITLSQCEELQEWFKKPKVEIAEVNEVLRYFERFDNPEERIKLSEEVEIAQKHFFENFELKEGSIFVNLVQKTIGLFDFELERSKFLKSAYDFWKVSYAKKPERVPENWRRIMNGIGLEANEENLFKFMFCLESAYSLFTRLILAKACEDYELPYVEFSRFIKTKIENLAFSYRGPIPLSAWAITAKTLIESMRQKLVASVFEGDIFYWWEDSYEGLELGALYSPKLGIPRARFGEALAEIILTLYKFDFSRIVGDPLGTLYQRYFDKETRKALGEFYTPLEVVTYILDAVGYEGRSVLGKRLLDPACGSGTFVVEALRRYLKASEQIAEEKGWPEILKELCNEYCIVGFDIHPFATFMAQMQFMLVLIPAYKKAMEEDPHFVLNRLPIFRTDSLIDETKGETRKVTLETFEKGIQYILIDTGLPLDSGSLKIQMPYDKDVFARTDLLNVQEYFAALQAVFDTVKEAAQKETYEVDTNELERNFKRYLEAKNWSGLVAFFTPYAEHFLQKFKELKETFGDGKLIKSLEDIMLAAILKNYVKYDFVVGNPPYVRVQMLEKNLRERYILLYQSATGRFDLYVLFMERGVSWLGTQGKLGFITSNKFLQTSYGEGIRNFITKETHLKQFIDFGDTGVFKDATNYPCIFVSNKEKLPMSKAKIVIVKKPLDSSLEHITDKLSLPTFSDEYISVFEIEQDALKGDIWKFTPPAEQQVIETMKRDLLQLGSIITGSSVGIFTGLDEAYIIIEETLNTQNLERDVIKPLHRGKNIRRWRIEGENEYIVYPYKDGSPVDLEFFPNILNYLKKFKSRLLDRESFGKVFKDTGKHWFEMWHPNFSMTEPKIITPDISTINNFALDETGEKICLKTAMILVFKNEYRVFHKFLLGILNSSATEFYFKHISSFLSGGYYRYWRTYLERLPIPLPQTPEEHVLADQITNKVEQILEQVKLEQQIGNFPDEYIQEYRSRGEEFEPVSIVFNSTYKALEPVIEKDNSGSGYNIVLGKKEKPIYVDSKLKADYVVAALKGKHAKKDEKLQLLIPKSDTVVEAILKELEEDKVKTKSPSVAELEAEINELVYQLYGLNEEDVKVIEEFLKRF